MTRTKDHLETELGLTGIVKKFPLNDNRITESSLKLLMRRLRKPNLSL